MKPYFVYRGVDVVSGGGPNLKLVESQVIRSPKQQVIIRDGRFLFKVILSNI